ncbi:hypothetical protein BACFIN_06621 [Bacteroides finegoldii DSM 17565]|nr:hypothetical protein BACFIN_06621 [Bacteroides finegoldii DSM 17565]
MRVFLLCSAMKTFTILQFTTYYFTTGQTLLSHLSRNSSGRDDKDRT